jgi:hypothetical protein
MCNIPHMIDNSDEPLARARVEWEASNVRLDQAARLLSAALVLHTAGSGPMPIEMMVEVDELRRESGRRFESLMAVMATGAASRGGRS